MVHSLEPLPEGRLRPGCHAASGTPSRTRSTQNVEPSTVYCASPGMGSEQGSRGLTRRSGQVVSLEALSTCPCCWLQPLVSVAPTEDIEAFLSSCRMFSQRTLGVYPAVTQLAPGVTNPGLRLDLSTLEQTSEKVHCFFRGFFFSPICSCLILK